MTKSEPLCYYYWVADFNIQQLLGWWFLSLESIRKINVFMNDYVCMEFCFSQDPQHKQSEMLLPLQPGWCSVGCSVIPFYLECKKISLDFLYKILCPHEKHTIFKHFILGPAHLLSYIIEKLNMPKSLSKVLAHLKPIYYLFLLVILIII